MEVWTIIGIIMLVSIITGATMHNAFWGIVSFSCSVTVLLIVLAIFRAIFHQLKKVSPPQVENEVRKVKYKNNKLRLCQYSSKEYWLNRRKNAEKKL